MVGITFLLALPHHQLVSGVGGNAHPLLRCGTSTYGPVPKYLAVE